MFEQLARSLPHEPISKNGDKDGSKDDKGFFGRIKDVLGQN